MSSGRSALAAVLVTGLLVGLATLSVAAAAAVPSPLQRYREAHLALAGGEYARARAIFDEVAPGFLLQDYAVFFAAEATLREGDEPAALARFRSFIERFPDSLLLPQAQLAVLDTTFRLGLWAEAEREARRFLARAPAHPEAGRVLVRLAQARAAQGQVAEAVADLRRRWIEAPASLWGEAAHESMEDLARAAGLVVAPLTVEEQFLQAQRLADAGEQTASVRLLEGLLAQGPELAVRHRALARLAPMLGRLARSDEAIARLDAALTEAETPSHAALLYELGRLLQRSGQTSRGAAAYERLLAEHPDASNLAEAALNLARTRAELGQLDAAREAFQGVVARQPDSQAAASARWELAWLEYRGGRFRDAALAFRQLSTTVGSARLAGLYWAGRSLDQLGEKGAALALYREVLSRGPQGYYGILAARRVRERPPAPVATPVRLAADPIALLRSEARYQRAQALGSIGFDGFAILELEALGRDVAADGDRAWALGVAFANLGEAGRSLRYLRRALGAAVEAGAPGLPPRLWQLYYPLGYGEQIRAAARAVGLDPFVVAAVIREESSYDPRARSGVGAVGLMQLMPDTARVVAQELGRPLAEVAALWEPPVNIALGARYLAQLNARFRDALLAVAAYNAGPHRVQRWVAERPQADMEEFVDQIPFDETRGFAKRVFTSWHHYRRLYGDGSTPGRRGEAVAAPRAVP
ncbi:MAG TPA: transglycosylase SLT domain-containing protein [Methylomirabilota bacterium]|jgi:soluble lytic murein transglycosylase